MAFFIQETLTKLELLSKDERRNLAKELANKYTQAHPVGCPDADGAQYLRHLFTHLPVDDISKYIGHWGLAFDSNKTEEQWIGTPAQWPSACRMMHVYYHPNAWHKILTYQVEKATTVNSHVFAGILTAVHDKEQFTALSRAYIDNPDSIWFKPEFFPDLEKMPDTVKEKIWLTLTHLKDDDLTSRMATSLGWDAKWAIGSALIKEQIFDSSYSMRKAAIAQINGKTTTSEYLTLPVLESSTVVR